MNSFARAMLLASICGAGSLASEQVLAADESILTPHITISEELTNNIREVQVNMRKEAITRLQPGFDLKYVAPRWNWDAGYNLDYRYYARQTFTDNVYHNARLDGKITVVDNFLFVELHDAYKLTSIDIARDATAESLNLGLQKTNAAFASAYIQKQFGGNVSTKSGYRYNDTRYFSSNGIEKSEHGAFVDLSWELAPKFSLTSGYAFSQNATTVNDITRHEATGGFRYEYADKSYIFAAVGNTWQKFSPGKAEQNIFWNAGLTHDFTFAILTLETRTHFAEDSLSASTRQNTYSGRIDKLFSRGSLGLNASYDEYFLTETDRRDRRRALVGGTLKYELVDNLNSSLSITADRTSKKTLADYPYRALASAGLAYAFNYGISLGGTYTYVTYRQSLRSAENSKQINRLIVDLKKVF